MQYFDGVFFFFLWRTRMLWLQMLRIRLYITIAMSNKGITGKALVLIYNHVSHCNLKVCLLLDSNNFRFTKSQRPAAQTINLVKLYCLLGYAHALSFQVSNAWGINTTAYTYLHHSDICRWRFATKKKEELATNTLTKYAETTLIHLIPSNVQS